MIRGLLSAISTFAIAGGVLFFGIGLHWMLSWFLGSVMGSIAYAYADHPDAGPGEYGE